jgi:hypothetical protein
LAKTSQLAIDQCVAELRAACRRSIDPRALEMLIDRLRPRFEDVLDHPEGPLRWTDHGQRMRDNARHLGALADFFAHQSEAAIVGIGELLQAFSLVEAACTVGAERSTHR